jgi:hypothetical protein
MQTWNRLAKSLRHHRQRLVAVLVALSVVVASIGVPFALESAKDTSQPYPCMHHRCGCGSAEACWRGCCCMTQAQKLAWAKEHGVTPPDYALAQAEQEEPQSCGSCGHHHDCESEPTPVAHTTTDEVKKSAGLGVGLVLSEDFRRCQGLASVWLTIGHALLPKVESRIPRFQPAPSAWLAIASQSAESPPLSLDTPPPRQS